MLSLMLPHELDEDLINLYYRALETYPECGGPEVVGNKLYNQQLVMMVWDSEQSKCVIIASSRQHGNGEYDMFVEMLAGKGALSEYTEIVNAVKELAMEYGCRKISTMMKPDLWKKMSSLGAWADEERYVFLEFNLDEKEKAEEENNQVQGESLGKTGP